MGIERNRTTESPNNPEHGGSCRDLAHAQWRRDRGIALVWVVLMLLVFVMFTGLALDTGYMVWSGQQLQIVADASALAGVTRVRTDMAEARNAAINVAAANNVSGDPITLNANWGNAADGDIVIGQFDRTNRVFTPDLAVVNAIKVTARKTAASPNGALPLFFGNVFGIPTVDVQRTAVAMVGGGSGGGIIVLNDHDRYSLKVSGNPILRVNGGPIQVNSDDSRAVYLGGNADIYCTSLNAVGGLRQIGNSELHGDFNSPASYMLDPLANLPAPSYNPSQDRGTLMVGGNDHGVVVQPGYYSGGITLTANSSSTLEPGIYVVGGNGFKVTGNADVFAEGVLIYVLGGDVDLTGNGDLHITAPDPSVHSFAGADTYQGVTIFQSRTNTAVADITGNSDTNLGGTFYFPSNHLNVTGNSDTFSNQIITNTLDVQGNGEMVVNYDGRFVTGGVTPFLVM